MRKNRDEVEEIETPELDLKSERKQKQKEGVERRKSAKKKDKIARWSGFILLLIVVTVGFLMWVAGEMGSSY